jgi:hypothetical protein
MFSSFFGQFFNETKKGLLTINFNREINPWELLQYCRKAINNIVKLTTINNIEILFKNEYSESDLGILTFSRDLHENVEVKSYPFEYVGNNYIKYYDGLGHNGETFWETFFKLERPIVCFEENNIFFPIYQHKNNTSVKLCSVIVNCPPVVNIGLNFDVGKLLENVLFYNENKEFRQLEIEEKRIEIESKKIDLLSKMIDLNIKIKNNQQHIDITKYLKIIKDSLITQQDILDYSYEIKSRKVDILI